MRYLFASMLAGLLVLPAVAQLDTGIIEGTVRDASGAAVPNASVTITETQTNINYNVASSSVGNYVSPPLKVGIYSVTATAPGFKTYTRSGITLQVQDRLTIDAKLEVGASNQQVVITGEAPLIQADTSSLGEVITAQQVVDMPLNGRNYEQLATLTAGVIDTSKNNTNGNTAGAFSSNGVRGDLNNYVLDGIDNNNNSGGGSQLGVNVDAIAEFKIQTSSYDAEFGRAGGAALNVVIKSGTNEVHGTLFEFFQNAYLNAQSFFATTRALSTKYNQPGGTLGFPIIKNKFFFFGDYQLTASSRPSVDRSSVPTLAERNGDFSAADNPGIAGLHTIYDPNTTNVANQTRQPFPGNIIPASDFSSLGYNIMQLYPLPNVPNLARNNYILEPTSTSSTSQGDGRGDYHISDVDSMFARFSEEGGLSYGAPKLPGLACGCSYSSQNNPSHGLGASVGETHIFTPTTLNEFRVGFNWTFGENGLTPGGFKAPPAALATPGVVNNPSLEGISYFAPAGYTGLGQDLFDPTWGNSEERQIRDTLNLVRGRHTIRVGGEMRWSEFDLMQLYSPRGYFQFTGQYTGNPQTGSTGSSLADMLLGIPQTSFIDSFVYLGNREKIPAFFVQDDYKVSSKLTLNLGLRYEFFAPIKDVHNAQSNFDYATGQLLVAGQNGNSDSLATAQHLNFGPRIGFAYNPFPKLVIRSAYGLFYSGQEVRTGDPLQLQYNLPFYYQPTFTGDGVTPANTLAQGFPSLVATGCTPVITSACQAVFPGATSLDSHVKTPYYQEWNFTIQRQLPGHVALEAAYVGSKGVHLQSLTDQNQIRVPGPGPIQPRRPYPFFSGFASIQMRGNSNFNAFELKLDKHLSNGLYFLSAYTFSHALDDTVPICCNEPWPDDSYNLKLLKGNADYQQKNRWVTSFDYLLPFGKGTSLLNNSKVLDLLVGGWHWSGIFTITSGFPFTPQQSTDSSNTGTQGFTNPNCIGNGNISGSQRTIYNWYNLNAFQDAPLYTFGNCGYNVLIGPGLINLDFGLRKVFNVTERQKLELRGEFFNTLNHPNFGQPDPDIDDGPYSQGGSAGTITTLSTNNRIIQVALKYRF